MSLRKEETMLGKTDVICDTDTVPADQTYIYTVYPERKSGMFQVLRLFTYGAVKRGFDLAMSAALLVGLSPMLLVVSAVIKLDSPGPVLFRQKRTGKNGKEFNMYKFRSMAADNDIRDKSCADKYTRVGKWLRNTSIDELPQLINVLRGQMSFVGPRPWVTEYWDNMNDYERRRAQVRPGITGLAAAKGRNGLSIFEKIDYDLEYVHNYSLKQDVKVILLTAKTVALRKSASSNKKVIHDELDMLKNRKA